LALINVTKRSASAFAVTDCSLIALSKEVFHKKMEELAREHQNHVFNYIECAPTFKKLTHAQMASLASHMHEVRFEKDTVIFNLGDFANCIYLIKSGEI
jgi:CRP-like cAMP-binding protein